jgi:hypothetical protein
MRASVTATLMFALVLVGCNGDGVLITGPAARLPSIAIPDTPAFDRDGSGRERPLEGRCATVFEPPTLPPPPVVRQVDNGNCQLSHLGQTALQEVENINFAAGTQTGELTFTAANGDILRAVNAGTSALSGPGRISFSATLTIVGGTGRFANATGQAHEVGVADLTTNTASFTLVGWIAYD